MGNPEGKRPLGRPRHRWKDNIKMGLQEVVFGEGGRGMDWLTRLTTGTGKRALVNPVMNLCVPQNAGNFLTS